MAAQGSYLLANSKNILKLLPFTGTARHSSFVLEAPTTGKMEIERFPKTLLALATSNLNTI